MFLTQYVIVNLLYLAGSICFVVATLINLVSR